MFNLLREVICYSRCMKLLLYVCNFYVAQKLRHPISLDSLKRNVEVVFVLIYNNIFFDINIDKHFCLRK